MRAATSQSFGRSVPRAMMSSRLREISPRSADHDVMALASQEGRILLTEDKDFGQLVYASAQPSGGVIFIRFPANARKALPKAVLNLIKESGAKMVGKFVVLRPGRVRIGGTQG